MTDVLAAVEQLGYACMVVGFIYGASLVIEGMAEGSRRAPATLARGREYNGPTARRRTVAQGTHRHP